MPTNDEERLALDDREVASRRAFFEVGDDDLARLAALRPLAERHADEIVDALYELFMGHPGSRAFFPDQTTLARVQRLQRAYFLGLFGGVVDARYVEDRLRIGKAHERIGMGPKWYIGAYARYLRIMQRWLTAAMALEPARAAHSSLVKLVMFDMSLALDAYQQASRRAIARQQEAIRELSTPVIRVHPRVLLLPLIGTLDTRRADQVMEALLDRVVQENARALIIDIAGVAIVDTAVADHLIQATAGVRILGAGTILTGIKPEIARVLVRLGVDVSAMHTCARLDEGIELALAQLGARIVAREAPPPAH